MKAALGEVDIVLAEACQFVLKAFAGLVLLALFVFLSLPAVVLLVGYLAYDSFTKCLERKP